MMVQCCRGMLTALLGCLIAFQAMAAPQRVVSLLPSSTEVVCRLQACDRLVGVDRHSNFPASVQALPRVGGLGAWSLEALVRLKPDLVLMPHDPMLAQRLQRLGLNHRVVDPKTLDQTAESFVQIALALGLPAQRGQALWDAVSHDLQQARRAVPQPWQQATIYLEADPSGYVAGPGSYLGQLVQALGLRNVVHVREPAYPQMSPEWVLQAQPDWVVLLSALSRPVDQRPGWQQLAAVRAGRVCQFTPEALDVIVRPGPRLAQAAQLLVGCMNSKGRP